jgi:hypothetical protein
MTNEVSLNLNTYSTPYFEMEIITLYGSWFFQWSLIPGSKGFPATHAVYIIINVGGKPLINRSIKHTKHIYMLNIRKFDPIFHNMKHIVNGFGNTI